MSVQKCKVTFDDGHAEEGIVTTRRRTNVVVDFGGETGLYEYVQEKDGKWYWISDVNLTSPVQIEIEPRGRLKKAA